MEIKTNEKELNKFIREKARKLNKERSENRKKTFAFWNKLEQSKKNIIVFMGFISGFILLASIGFVGFLDTNDNYISKTSCQSKMIENTAYYLGQEYSTWEKLLFVYSFPIKFLLIAIAISWIVHGVGFYLIRR